MLNTLVKLNSRFKHCLLSCQFLDSLKMASTAQYIKLVGHSILNSKLGGQSCHRIDTSMTCTMFRFHCSRAEFVCIEKCHTENRGSEVVRIDRQVGALISRYFKLAHCWSASRSGSLLRSQLCLAQPRKLYSQPAYYLQSSSEKCGYYLIAESRADMSGANKLFREVVVAISVFILNDKNFSGLTF